MERRTRNLLLLFLALVLSAGLAVGLASVGCGSTDHPCDNDPCVSIAHANAGSCAAVGTTDFTCMCQANFNWDAATNTCEAATASPCDSNPCDTFAHAVAGSCQVVNQTDYSCSCLAPTVTYDNTTKAIFDRKCVPCHRPGGLKPNPDLTTYTNVYNARNQILTDVTSNGLVRSWAGSDAQTIIDWINAGAPEADYTWNQSTHTCQ